ncbi:hypothetical protein F511_43709 [Dorcoceras hygrometricum]|uniref:Uncharacterized protein n=1 Tax=Dorcoceras hygrometricum TaxID=472368 RepID=A0A2Z7BDW7_9LAMI|nr:hypothetical protein F511_43709 [Dorcoceras hygrometricum]
MLSFVNYVDRSDLIVDRDYDEATTMELRPMCFDRSRAPIFLILPLHQHRIDVSAITNEEEGRLVEKEKEKEKEIEPVADDGMSLEKIIDSEDTDPLSKVLEMTTKSSTSDEESLSIDDLLAQIPEDMMLPYTTFAEPTRIKFGLGIEIKEIKEIKEGDWYKASLPQIDIADKGKAPLVEPDEIKGHPAQELFSLICANIDFLVQIRERVIEEIVSFFHSFSLRRLTIIESVSDIVAKEEKMLQWYETDSLKTAVQRRVYIIAKYRGMLLRKFLDARHQNFESGTPTTEIDLQILDMLSDAHHIALEILLKQKREHKLEWHGRLEASARMPGSMRKRHVLVTTREISSKNFLRICWSMYLLEPRYDVVLHELATKRGIGNQSRDFVLRLDSCCDWIHVATGCDNSWLLRLLENKRMIFEKQLRTINSS